MKQSLLLRVASVITLLYFAGHQLGMPWTPAQGPEQITLLQAMQSQRFDVMGFARSYWDFYIGFGFIISVFLLVQAVVLWQLSTLSATHATHVRPIIVVFFVSIVANAILSWRFFFAVPAVLAIGIAAALGLVFVAARPDPAELR